MPAEMRLPSYKTLAPIALLLGLAPFVPEPHLVEKARMLSEGTLVKPIDIFDLFWHIWPVGLIVCRFVLERRGSANKPAT